MKLTKKLLSAVLSCTIACISVMASASSAEALDIGSSLINDSTKSEESKALSEEPFQVFDIYNAYNGITTSAAASTTTTAAATTAVTTTTAAVTTTVISTTGLPLTTTELPSASLNGCYLNGIDVSEHQSYIDWTRVKASGMVDFAIIRAGYGRELYQRDKFFDMNMQNARENGIECGTYWFSYAMSVEEALLEAQTCYEIIKDYDYTFPVYYDMELGKQETELSTAEVSAMIDTFCSYLQERGVYVGVYSYASFLQTKVYENVLKKYDVWVAQYGDSVNAYSGDYGIWQYTSTGAVDGIEGDVDLDYCYVNYPYLVSPETYTGIVTTLTTASTVTAVQTTTAAVDPYEYSAKGVDVSAEHGYVNWYSVLQEGYTFAMIKAGEGGSEPKADTMFYSNMENAKANGINCGAYWHSRAVTAEDMSAEAEMFYEIIKDYKYEYPIFLDLSDPVIVNAGLSQDELTELIKTFCSFFESKRYYIGIRSFEYFLNTSVDPAVYDMYDVWLDNKGVSSPDFIYKYGIWQYDTAKVTGITGNVPLNYCYRIYPSVMTYFGLNGF